MVINKIKNQSFGMYVSPQVISNLRMSDVPKNEVEKTISYLQKLKISSETKLVRLEVGKFNKDNFDVISTNYGDIIERAFLR